MKPTDGRSLLLCLPNNKTTPLKICLSGIKTELVSSPLSPGSCQRSLGLFALGDSGVLLCQTPLQGQMTTGAAYMGTGPAQHWFLPFPSLGLMKKNLFSSATILQSAAGKFAVRILRTDGRRHRLMPSEPPGSKDQQWHVERKECFDYKLLPSKQVHFLFFFSYFSFPPFSHLLFGSFSLVPTEARRDESDRWASTVLGHRALADNLH